MSVDKWAYTPRKCDGQPCIGDCDLCIRAKLTDEDIDDIEADGFITNEADTWTVLEKTGRNTAKPAAGCIYPRCEKCDMYRGSCCTAQLVFSKQLWYQISTKMDDLEKKLRELELFTVDAVLGERDEP